MAYLKEWRLNQTEAVEGSGVVGPRAVDVKKNGKISTERQHRQIKFLNDRLEGDLGALKRVIRSMRGFKSMPTAYSAIRWIKVMRIIRNDNCGMLNPGVVGEARLVNRLFYL